MKKICLLVILCLTQFSFNPPALTWVAIGDSITYLNDHANETGNRISKGYMTQVVEKLPHIQFVNKGYNGWTAVRIATEFDQLHIPRADVYSIFLSTNDWWGSKPLGTWEDYLNNTGPTTVHGAFRIMRDKIKNLNPDAKIVFITPMQRVDFVYINNFKNNAYGSYKPKNGQNLEDFANAIVKIATYEKCPVVDLYHMKSLSHKKLVKFKRLKDPTTGAYRNYGYPDFIDVPFNPATDEYPYPVESIDMTYDGLHPSDAGYTEISNALVKILKRI